MSPSTEQLTDAIANATRSAVKKLFDEAKEQFYYCSLITTGEGHPPSLAAWSEEALERETAESNADKSEYDLKWSYADSPYYPVGSEYYEEVRRLFALRPALDPSLSEQEWDRELQFRLKAMEDAIRRLDEEGLFGVGQARLGIVVNVEVMPPDTTNTLRAKRLNPLEALKTWLEEIAEED